MIPQQPAPPHRGDTPATEYEYEAAPAPPAHPADVEGSPRAHEAGPSSGAVGLAAKGQDDDSGGSSDDEERTTPSNGGDAARALEEELAAASRPRSVVDELGWDHVEVNFALLSLADFTRLTIEAADAAAAIASEPKKSGALAADADKEESPREQLVAALRARLFEAQGETLVELGPIDSQREAELVEFLRSLCELELGARAQLILSRETGRSKERRSKLDILVRLPPSEQNQINLRVAVIGNVDAGKSTLVGVLVGVSLDNGRGSARLRVLKHKHEAESGRTSSIAEDQHLGFDQQGQMVDSQLGAGREPESEAGGTPPAGCTTPAAPSNAAVSASVEHAHAHSSQRQESASARASHWQLVARLSSKVVSFIDLAGHERYLKTTMFGMTAHDPDYALVVVGANHGVTRMTKEHLGIAIALHVPVLIVVTKVDMTPDNILRETLAQLQKLLRVPGARKRPFIVRGMEDVVISSRAFRDGFVAPIFTVSNVTGSNLELLQSFINLMPSRKRWAQRADGAVEFLIDQHFNVTGIGVVVAGTLVSGVLAPGEQLLLGPDHTGAFKPVAVKSIHHMRSPTQKLLTGQSGALLLRSLKRKEHMRSMSLRKGMVLLGQHTQPTATMRFTCDVLVLHSSTTMRCNYQPVLHVRNVRQSARIVRMDREVLRTGSKASIDFEFLFRPEFVTVGSRLIFREGKTKGIGNITHVFPANAETAH